MPMPPGGGGEAPPMDALSSTPMPAEGGIEGLMAALGGGGGGMEGLGLPGGAAPGEDGSLGPPLGAEDGAPDMRDMSPIDHIQHAMKHLMMAMASEDDDERGVGITKGMGALQALLGGEAKRQKTLTAAGG